MFKKLRNNIGTVILIIILGLILLGATYVNLGPTSLIDGDIGVTAGHGYYIDDVLLSIDDITTINLIVETDLKAVDEPADEDIFTYESTTGDFEWHSLTEIKAAMNLDLVANLKVKLDATGAPTVNNDVSEGYIVGSRWCDVTNDKEYVCLDNTDGAAVWTETTAAGYSNLTSFVDQTAWRVFYSNTDGDVTELAFGVDGTYLKSTGATSAPIFDTPSGAGDMLKATYDTDADGDIDVAAGGTEKSVWTLYAIPYLSGTTTFGEILIGTAEYALTVNAGATGYDWTLFDLSLYYLKTEIDTQGEMETIWGDTLMNDLVDDTTPQLGGDLDAQANHIGFTQQTITYNVTTTTVDWGAGNKATVTLTGNVGTMAFTNPAKPSNLLLKIVQDATGSRTITAWDADIKWAGGTAPTLTTTANGIDICSFYWDGTNYFGVASLAFATP